MKLKHIPRLRATTHLREISKTAAEAADFIRGHRLRPGFRRQLYRELRDIQIRIRHVYEEITGRI